MFSITGLASGLDTDNMLAQLMKVERLPVTRLEQQQTSLRRIDDAWGSVTKRLSALRTAIDAFSGGGSLAERWKASSSATGVATAAVTGTPAPGSLTFDVTQLARAQSSHNDTGLADRDALVGTGTFTLQRPDGTTIASVTTTATTTLSDLAAELNGLDGFHASVVKKADGDHRLSVTAADTGAANAFVVDTDLTALGTFAAGVSAQDAQLTVGGMVLTRSSNTITDLVDGVTVTIAGTGATTVATSQDVDGAVTSVKKVIDEVNATLSRLKDHTGYDPDTKVSGSLQGDPTARRLVDQLRQAVMDVVGNIAGNAYTSAGSVGITMNKDGGFDLDETKLRAALTSDPAAVDRLFARSGTTALGDVAVTSSTRDTRPGDHQLVVKKAATVASLTSATLATPPPNATYTITGSDGREITVTVADAASIAEAVAQINQQIAAASDAPTVQARQDGATIVLEQTRYGSARGLTVSSADDVYGLAGTRSGVDAEVEMYGDGTMFTGAGRTVRVTGGAADGLVLSVGPDADLDPAGGTVTVAAGVFGRLDALLANTYEGSTGAIQSARNSVTKRIDLYQDRIDDFEVRLASRETTLRRQFTAMEVALAELQSQGNWLAGQLAALPAGQE
jgi:flagellar hook-associated protein 2